MANLILPDEGLVAAQAALLNAVYPVGTCYLRLYDNAYTITKGTVKADLSEVNSGSYPGYAAQPITFSPGGVALDGAAHQAFVYSSVCTFTTSSGSADTVYGAFILDVTGTFLLAAYTFALPVAFDSTHPIVCQVKHTYESKY